MLKKDQEQAPVMECSMEQAEYERENVLTGDDAVPSTVSQLAGTWRHAYEEASAGTLTMNVPVLQDVRIGP